MAIEVKNLTYTYSANTPFEKRAITDISFSIKEGETVGIIGSTGSGKSTLIQHLNGLIRAESGSIKVYDIDLTAKKPNFKRLRSMVGMLFQYPEYQLFEDTVLKDVSFAPRNFGYNAEQAARAAREAIELVGLDYEIVKDKSPFELSGGEKRRVAIAGVIAYRPKILILDEPTAGLDPAGKKEILSLIQHLKSGGIRTVIAISHNMDEIAEYTERVLVLNEGRLVADKTPKELFADKNAFANTGLALPHTANIANLIREKGADIPNTPLTTEELCKDIVAYLGGDNG
ncbi:MAG: energy-coupling factor transporter ATPase [Clostridia bacterium]